MPGVQLIYDTTCTSTSDVVCNWTVPAGVYSVTFELWGGGGGGGNRGTMCDCCGSGISGAGGGYSKKTVTTVPGCIYAITAGKAGVASNGFGSYCAYCCVGCAGGTSYVTGYNVPASFCATGGQGGYADFNSTCYPICGCNWFAIVPGCGYNGDVVSRGSTPVSFMYSSTNAYNGNQFAGGAGGPGGGAGGVNPRLGYCHLNGGSCCCGWAVAGESPLHGRVPGGGGAGGGNGYCCTCWPVTSGRGAPGMVKITY